MRQNLCIFILMGTFSILSHAVEVGISSSGKDISLDIWFQDIPKSENNFYTRIIYDFDGYHNGANVTVCNDGTISGSTGSGTCSNHGGVNSMKEAEFDRLGFAFGLSNWVSNKVQLHGGLIIGLYSSDINIGDSSEIDFTKFGLDLGISYQPSDLSNMKIVVSYETEQKRSSIGFWFPF